MSATLCIIELFGIAHSRAFDDALVTAFRGRPDTIPPSAYELNMQGLTYTDLQNMQRIICFAEFCQREGVALKFVLPTNDKLLRFWHSWNFFGTIESVIDDSIDTLVDESQRESLYFDGSFRIEDETVRLLAPDVPTTRKQNFFSFFCEAIGETSKTSIPAREKGYWERDEVVAVLHRVFGENFGDNIGCDIVSETLFNSTRHSKSTKITSASFCKSENGSEGDGNFQLVFWDNGEPIYETLRRPLEDGKSVREYAPKGYRERHYVVSYPDFPAKVDVHRTHDEEIHKEDKDSELFLSALFPGVTSKPYADQEGELGGAATEPELRIQRGMGFDFVLDTAVHGLGGSVSIRSGKYFAKIKKVKTQTLREQIRKVDTTLIEQKKKTGKTQVVPNSLLKMYDKRYFSVSFRQIPDDVPMFNGNLISISVTN